MDTLSALRLLVAGRYIDLSAGCLAIFDFLLTLDLEVEFIWKSEMNIMKGMFFFNRYTAILEFIFLAVRSVITNPTLCPDIIKAEGVIYILGIYSAECIFAIRTYVIWEKNKTLFIPLSLFYLGTLIYSFISYYAALNTAQYGLLPVIGGCLAVLPPSGLYISMIMLVAYDAAMILLVSWATINVRRRCAGLRPDLFTVLYGEGILFYVYLLVVSVMSLVGVKVSSPFLFIYMGRCVRSVLASRVILHLRQSARSRSQVEYPLSSWRRTVTLP